MERARIHALAGALCLSSSAWADPGSSVSPEPIDPGHWIFTSDYPAADIAKKHQGTVEFQLTIDTQGLPISCQILSSSGWPSLDEKTCAVMLQRGRFKPARDEASAPVVSTWFQRIRWRTPAAGHAEDSIEQWADLLLSVARLPQGDEARVTVREIVEANGAMASCAPEKASQWPQLDALACREVSHQQAGPARDASNQPVRTLHTWRVGFVTREIPARPAQKAGLVYVGDGMPARPNAQQPERVERRPQ